MKLLATALVLATAFAGLGASASSGSSRRLFDLARPRHGRQEHRTAFAGRHPHRQPPSGTYATQYESTSVIMSDRARLPATGFRPVPRDNATAFPVLLFPSTWAAPMLDYALKTSGFAGGGYIAMSYEARGWNGADGEIDFVGPRDLEDASAVLSFVLNQTSWQPDPSNVAFVGVSYGAAIALSMAGYDDRVTTAVMMSGWSNVTQVMLPRDTPNKVWGGLLLAAADWFGHPLPVLQDMYQDALAHKNMSWLESFCEGRSPMRFVKQIEKRDVPLFFSHNRLDRIFRAEFAMDFWSSLKVSHKFLMVNQGVHGEPELFGMADLGKNKIWANARLWLDHFLLGRSTNILQQPRVQLQLGDTITAPTYVGFSSWPSNAVQRDEFIMQPRGSNHYGSLSAASTMTASGASSSGSSETITYTELPALTAGVPVLTALWRAVGLPYDTAILLAPTSQNMIYRSDALGATTRYCGIPSVTFAVTASQPSWQIYAFLYDVDALDVAYLISNAFYTHVASEGASVSQEPTIVKNLEFHTVCQEIPAGHRIAVGFVLYSSLYEPVQSGDLSVTFHYHSGAPTLIMPLNQQ